MQRRSQGLFALHWQANQHYYGLGIEIDQWLAQGISVVVNGSRAHLPIARERYGDRMQAVCLQVSQTTLRQRLLARGNAAANRAAFAACTGLSITGKRTL